MLLPGPCTPSGKWYLAGKIHKSAILEKKVFFFLAVNLQTSEEARRGSYLSHTDMIFGQKMEH